jgi:hypothetical protein
MAPRLISICNDLDPDLEERTWSKMMSRITQSVAAIGINSQPHCLHTISRQILWEVMANNERS